jgi:hypothetical protein
MDPNATITALFAARRDGDQGTAQELARALLGWLDMGAFPPDGFTTEEAYIEALDVLFPDPAEPDRPTPLADDAAEPSQSRATAQTSGRAGR